MRDELGDWLENRHQTKVALDVMLHDRCLRYEEKILGSYWSSTECPR